MSVEPAAWTRRTEWKDLEPALLADLIEEGWPPEAFDAGGNVDFDVLRAHDWIVHEDNGLVAFEAPKHVRRLMEERHPPRYAPHGYDSAAGSS
jgi:membrane-anchored protein YejM (alkaline phosphatase superfamily)